MDPRSDPAGDDGPLVCFTGSKSGSGFCDVRSVLHAARLLDPRLCTASISCIFPRLEPRSSCLPSLPSSSNGVSGALVGFADHGAPSSFSSASIICFSTCPSATVFFSGKGRSVPGFKGTRARPAYKVYMAEAGAEREKLKGGLRVCTLWGAGWGISTASETLSVG